MQAEQAHTECDCAPSPDEKRRFWPHLSRRSALGVGALGAAVVAGLAGPIVAPAFAATYPSWEDVERAKANESAKNAEIARIQQLIRNLEADVAAKNAAAETAANEYFVAQQEYSDAAFRADQLQAEADAQAATAKDAAEKAGKVAAQLYRSGGDDTALELFFSGSAASADELLDRLGTMDKLLERNHDVYAQAITARDAAQNLTDQAEVQRAERDRLQKIAESKMIAAQQAAEAAEAALATQEVHRGELQAQLAALQDTTQKTVAQYQEGERIRKEEERRRAEEAARRAKEEAEKQSQNSGGGGGSVGGSGWARPSSGGKTSGYGPRYSQCGNGYCASGWHLGVDMATGCGAGIYAAAAGRVTYATWYGGYGRYVRIDHGNGISTGYGHASQILVGWGQNVSAGQLIAREGQTGNSFGCHLHFEVYTPSGTVDPSPFMAARGIRL